MTSRPRGEPVAPGPPAGPIPADIVGRDVKLRRPRPAADSLTLFGHTHGGEVAEAVWDYMGYGPWSDVDSMQQWMETTIHSVDPYWWTAEVGGEPVGMLSLLNRDETNRRAELGHIWYIPAVQRTTINTEVAYLLLDLCFATLRCRRVEWKCDALNQPSRDAALRLGFRFEGVFRNHMIVKGRNRDTAWFAMTDDDWSRERAALHHWLYEVDRDDSGRPVEALRP